MLNPSDFQAIVSGTRRGGRAAALRAALRLAETPYAAAMRIRNWRYDRGLAQAHRIDVPVISVGNLTLGGTGKTPVVAWLARWLRQRHLRVTIVSRGYGAEAGARNDEALELEQQMPDVPHLQNPDRVAAARLAIEEFECQVILLDDGFQHRRLARDLDIVLIDALQPFGYGHVFPRGTLREPLCGLRRAQIVLLSRADMLSREECSAIRQQILRYARDSIWAEIRHAPQVLLSASGRQAPLDGVRGMSVLAFCGLGNPAGFRHTLDTLGCQVIELREFPDHYAYSRADLEQLAAGAIRPDVQAILCSHKDLVKLGVDELGGKPLWAVSIGIEFHEGLAAVEARLASVAPRSTS